jgi:putative solute:sodium symporter small subunit
MTEKSDPANPVAGDHPKREKPTDDLLNHYWRANIRLMLVLLAIWFTVSFGFGIFFVEQLNQFTLFGFKLGFWWAQQGSIYTFVILIGIYVFCIHRIDQRHGVDDD